ncbi:MAG: beta-N-acetylhexosaminidase [Oscillospiraceae bacterium]|jgi:hexosaminidase|nr:beta-N-acetylhexosaminidase [Oscillospiraceae bacterium]
MNIIPKPMQAELTSDKFYNLSSPVSISCAFDEVCCKAFLERTGLEVAESRAANITIRKESEYSEEEYTLEVKDDGVTILTSSEKGGIHALATLFQIMTHDGNIPYCKIHDRPRFSHRGLSLDCARHFFPVEEIKKVIEQMTLTKMNVLHWHLTDDQGWRIESKCYPKLHMQHKEKNEYYSQQDIRDIVAFAAERGMEIIPEIDMPGHVTAILAAYPEYSCQGKEVSLAKYGGIYPIVFCAGSEKTYQLIEKLLEELCLLFPSSRFHLGGDEVPKKEWKKCECCQAKIREMGLSNEIELQGYFTNRLIDILKKHGKRAVLWNDSLEAANLNRDVDIQYWSVQYADDMTPYVKGGGKFIYSDMVRLYFNSYAAISLSLAYNGPIKILDTDYENSDAVLGIEACLWSEQVTTPERLMERLFPRLYAIAEVTWSHVKNYEDFKARLTEFLEKHHSLYMRPSKFWDPEGDIRREEMEYSVSTETIITPPEVHRETMDNFKPNQYFIDAMTSTFSQEEREFMAKLREANTNSK